ncbi:hypothetical protein bcgnr5372_21200 [Bacillus luti]
MMKGENNFTRKRKDTLKIGRIFIFLSVLLAWSMFLILQLTNNEDGKEGILFSLTVILCMLVWSTYKAYKVNDLLQPIMIINLLVFCIFIARPIQLIWGNAISTDDHVFLIYNNLYGITDIDKLPFDRVLYICIIGLISLYAGYYLDFSKKKNLGNDKKKDFDYSPVLISEPGIKNGISWCRFYLLIALVSCLLFFARFDYSTLMSSAGMFASTGISFGTFDILWIYIGTCILIFLFLIKGRITLTELCIIIAYIILIAALSKRAYMVNILLCMLVLMYYIRFQKKIKLRLVLIGIAIVASVVIYGSIRAANIDRPLDNTVIGSILSEFSMFDMFVVSLDYEERFGRHFFGGFNYLVLITGMIPSSIWPGKPVPFDHAHTELVFNGLYGGAVPTSLFGSLYFNFSYVGVAIGLFIFGIVLKKIYQKLKGIKTRLGIGIYALFTTFLYDIIRVGDIGREFWTFMVYLGVFLFIGCFVMAPRNLFKALYYRGRK